MMKICVITTSFPRFKGDYSGLFVFRLCQSLAALNLTVNVVAPADSKTPATDIIGACRVHRFSYFFPKSLQKLSYGPGGLPANLKRNPLYFVFVPFFITMFLAKTLRISKNADLIHAQWLYSGIIASVAKRIRGTPFVLTLRGSDVRLAQQRKLLFFIARWVIARASFITTVSEDMKSWLIQQGISDDVVAVIRNGVDLNGNQSKDTPRPEDGCHFIFVGNLVPGKGVRTLIEAFTSFSDAKTTFHLKVVGDGEERCALEILTREKGLGDFVSFTGVQPHETIPALLREADCLVLPSLSEGMPNVVLEAMASGLPVVASNLPGIREVVQDGETGLLAEPGDARGLAKKLMTMIHEPEQRREMGRRGYRYITAMNLSWEQSARHYLEVYRKACAASRVSST